MKNETIIFQVTPSGYYDYSEYGSAENAWEAEQSEQWVQDMLDDGASLDDCRDEFLETLITATREEALQAANDGYAWPMALKLCC